MDSEFNLINPRCSEAEPGVVMRLCYQPRQRVEQDPGESENPMLILFNNHASMTNFVVGIHSVRLVGLRICHPCLADGLHTFIPHPRAADEPYPGL